MSEPDERDDSLTGQDRMKNSMSQKTKHDPSGWVE